MKVSPFVKRAIALCAGFGAFLNPSSRAAPGPIVVHGAALANTGKDMIAQRIRVPRTLDERQLLSFSGGGTRVLGTWPFNCKNRSQRASLRWAFRCMSVPGY